MKKLLGDKDPSFDMTHVREEESDSKSVKGHKMYMENPREGIKKPWFEQERNILARLNLYYVLEGEQFTIKLPFFPNNSPLSSQNIWLGSCPRSSSACFFYTLRNMVEYKDRCQVIIFYLLRSFL